MLDEHRLIFLFGAGTSTPAGMPSTDEITERVMNGNEVFRHSDEAFYLGTKPSLLEQNTEVDIALEVVSIFDATLKEYYSYDTDRIINYEDIYALAYAVYRAHVGASPELQPLLDHLAPCIDSIIQRKKKDDLIIKFWNPIDVCRNAVNYIRDIVWHLLSAEPTEIAYLRFIKAAYEDSIWSNIDIFTLNNDTVFEKYLNSERITHVDGFGQEENRIRYWNPQLYLDSSIKVRIHKLHGSANWFRFTKRDSTSGVERIGIPTKPDIYHMKDANGVPLFPEDGRPLILVGTDNKIFSYSSGIYLRLISDFQRHMDEVNKLVVSGYSFGDFGINRLLFDWLDGDTSRKILLVSRDIRWLEQQGQHIRSRVDFANKWIEEMDYSEIRSFFSDETLK